MISRGGNKYNCCESALIRIDQVRPLPGFGTTVMKVASGFGGGVGGWGSVCGAVSGVAMAFGLLYGSEGGESPDVYTGKRGALREMSQEFFKAFEAEYGSVNCVDLLGVDRRTEEGNRRYEELREQGAFNCDGYVDWAVEKALEMLSVLD